MAMLEVSHLEKHFGDTEVLKDINFSLDKGQSLAIIGSSGSGKTTLLRCLNFLERPDSGTIHVDGQLLLDGAVKTKTSDSEVRKKRLKFGLVFQNFNLFPQYTALENVMLASQLLSKERPDYKQRKKEILAEIRTNAEDLLTQVGLKDRMNNYPDQLSGGQQQRVAIARRWRCTRISSASTNLPRRWIRAHRRGAQGDPLAVGKAHDHDYRDP